MAPLKKADVKERIDDEIVSRRKKVRRAKRLESRAHNGGAIEALQDLRVDLFGERLPD